MACQGSDFPTDGCQINDNWKKTEIIPFDFALADLTKVRWWLISLSSPSLLLPEADSYLTRFAVPQTYNYSALLVDPASRTLYVGARDAIFAISLPFSEEKPRKVRDEKGGGFQTPWDVIRSVLWTLWVIINTGIVPGEGE